MLFNVKLLDVTAHAVESTLTNIVLLDLATACFAQCVHNMDGFISFCFKRNRKTEENE